MVGTDAKGRWDCHVDSDICRMSKSEATSMERFQENVQEFIALTIFELAGLMFRGCSRVLIYGKKGC